MPYSSSYLVQNAARGRPRPDGTPEDHLWDAVQRGDVWLLNEAWSMGASPHARNGRGLSVLAAITLGQEGRHAEPRFVALLESAWRHGSRLGRSQDDVAAFQRWMRSPQGLQFALSRGNLPWLERSAGGQIALHVLAEHATPEMWSIATRRAPVPSAAWETPDSNGNTPSGLRNLRMEEHAAAAAPESPPSASRTSPSGRRP